MSKVNKRDGFSDRNNIKSINTEIQLYDFDERTRIQLQNMINKIFAYVYCGHLRNEDEIVQEFYRFVLGDVYSEAVDIRKTYRSDKILSLINDTIMYDDYDDILTVIEAIVQFWHEYLIKCGDSRYYNKFSQQYLNQSLFEVFNNLFQKEYIGYRFINKIIVSITDKEEVDTINEALTNKHQQVYNHLTKANRLLADRETPDYENSIKESICAVEALCELITGLSGKDATLGKMLNKLEDNGIVIHGALKLAFEKLYGYTSDAKGIRHAGQVGGADSTFEEAKYMLVSCSAFINYIMARTSD